jgi:hypothetical protein
MTDTENTTPMPYTSASGNPVAGAADVLVDDRLRPAP